MDRDPIAFLSLLLYRSLPLRRQGKHLVELTLCATMQEWVMKAAGARCWTSIWYVCGDGLIPKPSIFSFFFLQVTQMKFFLCLRQCLVTRMERKQTKKSWLQG